jgi:hypothetical protein
MFPRLPYNHPLANRNYSGLQLTPIGLFLPGTGGCATMARKYLECQKFLSDDNCTLSISGTEEEVLDLAVLHAVVSHDRDDPHELRAQLRLLLVDVPEAKTATA